MKRIFTIFIFLIIATSIVFSTEIIDTVANRKSHPLAYNGYQGGMMLHLGYARSGQFQFQDMNGNYLGDSNRLNGTSLGSGGALRVGFGKYLRVGIEGYVSTHKYKPNASSAKIGWGGLLIDSHWHINKFTIFTGSVFGGGSYTHITLIDCDHNNPAGNYAEDYVVENQYVSYRHYPFFVIAPFVGMEYSLTKRISLVAKIDYMLNASNWSADYATGPRVFIGFMFGR